MEMEVANHIEDVVIVGAGIAGLTTALSLHRLGIKSLVLESSRSLRASGFAYTTWTNAWKAFDAIGIAHSLRQQHPLIHGFVAISTITAQSSAQLCFRDKGKEEIEARCVKRQVLLESLARELPNDTINYSSKVGSIEESGYFKLLYLNDGTIIKTKVLIGCDGVNSVVANWLGFKKPAHTNRESIRGFAHFKQNHGFDSKFLQFYGHGYRSGLVPCDDTTIYWFFTWTSSNAVKKLEDNPIKMKEFVLSKLQNEVHHPMKKVVENTQVENMIHSHLRYRHPWEFIWGHISKGNTCVAGDALHPMTPDLGQGGCSALEDGVILARCLAEALKEKTNRVENYGKDEYKRIEIGLKNYAQQRRWRSFDLVTTSYVVGYIQQSKGKILSLFRDKILSKFLVELLLKKSHFDCGKLITIS